MQYWHCFMMIKTTYQTSCDQDLKFFYQFDWQLTYWCHYFLHGVNVSYNTHKMLSGHNLRCFDYCDPDRWSSHKSDLQIGEGYNDTTLSHSWFELIHLYHREWYLVNEVLVKYSLVLGCSCTVIWTESMSILIAMRPSKSGGQFKHFVFVVVVGMHPHNISKLFPQTLVFLLWQVRVRYFFCQIKHI